MPRISPFHTVEEGKPVVYHNNSACADGKRIKPEHYRTGTGIGRRLCDECERLNEEARWSQRPIT